MWTWNIEQTKKLHCVVVAWEDSSCEDLWIGASLFGFSVVTLQLASPLASH
jgi:hypothetical protein